MKTTGALDFIRATFRRALCAYVGLLLLGLGCTSTPEPQHQPQQVPPQDHPDAKDIEESASPLVPGSENPLGDHLEKSYIYDLKEIRKLKYIRVLTTKNAFDYYLSSGQPMGIQYEMVKGFVEHLNKKFSTQRRGLHIQFEMIPVDHDQLLPLLKQGYADMIAAAMSITPERKKEVAFSEPYQLVNEVLVGRKGSPLIESFEQLLGKTLGVRKSSSYYQSLGQINAKRIALNLEPLNIKLFDEGLETSSLMELVSLGKLDYTVADSPFAQAGVSIFDNLQVESLALKKDVPIAWATHATSQELLKEMNEFLPLYAEGSLLGNLAKKKYFRNFGKLEARYRAAQGTGRISPYERLIKKYSKQYGLDWRLMTALCYQESKFKADIVNQYGAIGLFQIKAPTAKEMGFEKVKGKENISNNVHAGIKYLHWLKTTYFDHLKTVPEKARVRMALAAYNAGPGRVQRARQYAVRLRLDPNLWFRNVEIAMAKMGYSEPVQYVSDINKRYLTYVMLGYKN